MVARKRDRAFRTALAVSLVVHLSAVTVFSIVITFPREPVTYYSFRFVDAATREPIFRSDQPWPRTVIVMPPLPATVLAPGTPTTVSGMVRLKSWRMRGPTSGSPRFNTLSWARRKTSSKPLLTTCGLVI